jgi:predicted dehydrogenase
MAEKLSFIMVGCGGIANAWLRVFQEFKNEIELAAVCDPIPTAFNKLKSYGYEKVPTFNDLSLAFTEGIEAKAILVLTPPQYHPRYIREAVYNDCHVLTEKPFFCDLNDYRTITQDVLPYAEENDLIAVVNQQYRWMPRIQDIKKVLNAGSIGQIGFVTSHFCQNRYHFNAWWRQEQQDLSQFNWFIHHYDTMRYMLGKNPISVQAKLFRVPWSKIYGESTIFLNVTFQDGIEWEYTGVQEGIGGFEDSGQSSFTIYGSKGCIINTRDRPPLLSLEKGDPHKPEVTELGPMRPEDIISTDSGKGDTPDAGPKYPPGWSTTMRYFIDAVKSKNKTPHPTSFKDNLHTIAIPLCARESWRRHGAPVNVKDFLGLDPTE